MAEALRWEIMASARGEKEKRPLWEVDVEGAVAMRVVRRRRPAALARVRLAILPFRERMGGAV